MKAEIPDVIIKGIKQKIDTSIAWNGATTEEFVISAIRNYLVR